MHNHVSTVRVESKLIPGVAYIINAPSYGRRLNLDRATAEFRSQTRVMQKKYDKIVEQIREGQVQANAHFKARENELERELCTHVEGSPDHVRISADIAELKLSTHKVSRDLTDQLNEINEESLYLLAAKYNAPRVRHYLKAIEGYQIDGVDATVDSLLAEGAPQIVTEILESVDAVEKMKAEEIKNLSSPSTSSNPADGETNDTTVTIAESGDTTQPATA
jgi:hypothetical protein